MGNHGHFLSPGLPWQDLWSGNIFFQKAENFFKFLVRNIFKIWVKSIPLKISLLMNTSFTTLYHGSLGFGTIPRRGSSKLSRSWTNSRSIEKFIVARNIVGLHSCKPFIVLLIYWSQHCIGFNCCLIQLSGGLNNLQAGNATKYWSDFSLLVAAMISQKTHTEKILVRVKIFIIVKYYDI